MKNSHCSGYVLMEVLTALFLLSYLILPGLHWQLDALKKASQHFEELSAINQAQNLMEAFRANPLDKDFEFNQWKPGLLAMKASYHCQFIDQLSQCEVLVQWNQNFQDQINLSAIL